MTNCGATNSVPSTLTSFLRFAAISLVGLGIVLWCRVLLVPMFRYTGMELGAVVSWSVAFYLWMMSWLRGLLEYLRTRTSSPGDGSSERGGLVRTPQEERMQGELRRFQAWWSSKALNVKKLSRALGLLSVFTLGVFLATVNRRWEVWVYQVIISIAGMLLCWSVGLVGMWRLASRVADLMKKQDAL